MGEGRQLDIDQAFYCGGCLCSQRMEVPMSEAADAIMAAIHSAFDSYPKEGDPE